MKQHKLRKLGVIVLLIVLTFSTGFIVDAKTTKKKTYAKRERETETTVEKKECSSEKTLIKKYNVKFRQEADETYTLSVNPDDKALKDVVFKVVKIGNRELVEGQQKTLKKGSPLKGIFFNDADYIKEGQNELTAKISITTKDDPDCDEVNISAAVTKDGNPIDNQKETVIDFEEGDITSKNPIDCNAPANPFEQAFCEAKKNAYALSRGENVLLSNTTSARKDKNLSFHYQDLGTKPSDAESKINGTGKLTCSYKLLDKEHAKLDYYQNKSYYYAQNVTKHDEGQYEYHFSPGLKVHKEGNISCKIKCEEAVVVEYGPPVASKAGLCFEYKVKVTSRVSCDMVEAPSKPKIYTGYCTPSPICTGTTANGNTYTVTEGGPNEEFDQCVKDCDGGKYTQKCSNKCYNEVYGKSKNASLALNYSGTIQKMAKSDFSLSACLERNPAGCYYYSDNGAINWKQGNDAVGRWYREYGYKDYSSYKPINGIYRHDYGNGNLCTDTCWWSGCRGKYLNPGDAEKDAEENLEKYKDAVRSCKAAATCTTKTAEFTISAKYDTKDGSNNIKVNEINFPYNNDKDKIESKGPNRNPNVNNTAKCYKEGGKVPTANCKTTVLDYDGCYYSGSDNDRLYMTEWSFPGTWINNKTGEISFKYKEPSSGWYTEKNKFCIPLNAESVNTKWWEWTKIGNNCMSEDAVKRELDKDYDNDSNSNGYNIKALAKNFGYFGWNFNIQCFYALKNEECKIDDRGCCNPTCQGKKCDDTTIGPNEGYTIRVIDRNNLFPNSGADVSPTNPSKREIGFNWTTAATIPDYKNPSYAVDPAALIAKIQNNSKDIYTDEDRYLDYEFFLTPTTLNKIRSYNKKNTYGTWNGTTIEKGGLNVYQSNLFRAGVGNNNILSDGAITKRAGKVGVNNEKEG